MTASDMADIEAALGIKLPPTYRSVMLLYPLNPKDRNSQIALMGEAKAVIAFNRFLRETFPDEWQPGYFAVGNSPCGDPYFLDPGNAAVWLWDHETHEIAQEAADFSSWLAIQRSLEKHGGA